MTATASTAPRLSAPPPAAAAIALLALLLPLPSPAQDPGQQDFEDTVAGAEDATEEARSLAEAARAMLDSLTAPPTRSFPSHLEPEFGDSPEGFLAPVEAVIAQLACDSGTPGPTCSIATPDRDSFLGTGRRMAGAVLATLSILALVFAGLRMALHLEAPIAALWQAASGIFIAGTLLVFWNDPFLGLTMEMPAGYSADTTHAVPATIPALLRALPLWIGSSVDAGFGAAWELAMLAPQYGFTLGRGVAEGLVYMLIPSGWPFRETIAGLTGSWWSAGGQLGFLFSLLVGGFVMLILLYVLFKAFSQFILAEIFVIAWGAIGILFVPFYALPATRFLFMGWLKTYISINLYALLTKLLAGVALALISGQMAHGISWLAANPAADGTETLSFAAGNLFMLILIAISSSQLLGAAGPFSQALASGSAAAPPSGGGPLLNVAAGAASLAGTVASAGLTGAATALGPGALGKAAAMKNVLPRAR